MENPCNIQVLREQEAAHWFISPNYRWIVVWKYERVVFLSQEALGILPVHLVDYVLQQWCFQTLACCVCEMAVLPWLHDLAMCWFYLILKRRISHAKLGLSSKDIMIGVPFIWWKICAMKQCTERKRQHIFLFPQIFRRIWGGRARVALLSKVALELLSFHWVEYTLQQCRFQPLVCEVCEKFVLPWFYGHAMLLFPELKSRIHHAKSDFSSKENMFAVPLKQWKLHEPNHSQRGRGRTLLSLPWWLENSIWERQGLLSWVKTLWGWSPCTDLNVLRYQNTSKMFFSVVYGMAILHWLYELSMSCFSPLVQRCPIWCLQNREYVWTAFSTMESPCTKPGLQEE